MRVCVCVCVYIGAVNELLIAQRGPGEMVGEMALFNKSQTRCKYSGRTHPHTHTHTPACPYYHNTLSCGELMPYVSVSTTTLPSLHGPDVCVCVCVCVHAGATVRCNTAVTARIVTTDQLVAYLMEQPMAKHQIREGIWKKESEITIVDALVKLANAYDIINAPLQAAAAAAGHGVVHSPGRH